MHHLKRNFLITLLIFLVNPLFANDSFASLDEEASKEILENLIILEEVGIDLQTHALTQWFQAARLGYLDIVTLLHKYIPIDTVDEETEMTALGIAAANGRLDVIQFLLKEGASLKVIDDESPFYIAIENGNIDAINLFLDYGEKISDYPEALDLAAAYGQAEILDTLLSQGLLSESLDSLLNQPEFSPIHTAAEFGQIESLKVLIDYNAPLNKKNDREKTPIDLAIMNGHKDVAFTLIENGAELGSLYKNTLSGNLNMIKSLLKVDSSILNTSIINILDHNGLSIMHYAVFSQSLDVVKYLLDQGAPINNDEDQMMEPLALACKLGNLDIINELLKSGANPNNNDYYNYYGFNTKINPLLLSVGSQNIEAVETLVKAGANIDDESFPFKTFNDELITFSFFIRPIEYACFLGNVDIVKYLIDNGAIINNCYSIDFMTAYHFAARKGHAEIIDILAEAREVINDQEERNGWTPLHVAARYGHLEAVKKLISLGADSKIQDRRLRTASILAGEYGHWEIVRFLRELS